MLTLQQASTPSEDHPDEEPIREIHALTPPPARRSSHRSSSLSSDGATSSENFTSMSREFNALVLAGSTIETSDSGNNTENYNYPSGTNSNLNGASMIISDVHYNNNNNQLARIGEEELETNPLAIVPDSTSAAVEEGQRWGRSADGGEISVQRVKKEEAETKISAWENAKIAKINNRFKRDEAVISGWESEEVQKATSWLNKIERKLEEKRVRAVEKMQNRVAKAHRKAEERRASAEGKRGIKVASVFEMANLMRAVGRPPAKRSFF